MRRDETTLLDIAEAARLTDTKDIPALLAQINPLLPEKPDV